MSLCRLFSELCRFLEDYVIGLLIHHTLYSMLEAQCFVTCLFTVAKARCWLITSFNNGLIERMRGGLPDGCDFFVGQSELCPTTGRKHEQCYLELSAPRTIAWLKRTLADDTIHCERRAGSQLQAIQYCEKDDTFDDTAAGRCRIGRPHGGGRDNSSNSSNDDRLRLLFNNLTSGYSAEDAFGAEPSLWCRYGRELRPLLIQHAVHCPYVRRVQVNVFIGPPGSGKTHEAYFQAPTLYRLPPPQHASSPVWFDGYTTQEAILIDDFDGWIPYRTLLQWLDIYPLLLPIKGGFVVANYSKVFITSNTEMNMWFGGDITALERRVTQIKHFTVRNYTSGGSSSKSTKSSSLSPISGATSTIPVAAASSAGGLAIIRKSTRSQNNTSV